MHRQLEERIARFKGTEDAIVFSSGYLANLGVISALVGRGDLVLSDELNHASIIDGCRLSRATVKVFRHKDVAHLRDILVAERNSYRRCLIVTDGIFSMDGDIAPLPHLLQLAEEFQALLMVDDAHATGVLGKRGAGTVEHFDLEGQGIIQMGTLSKALGSEGGYVAGNAILVDYLRNRARSFIFSTALSPPVVAGVAHRICHYSPDGRGSPVGLGPFGNSGGKGHICAGHSPAYGAGRHQPCKDYRHGRPQTGRYSKGTGIFSVGWKKVGAHLKNASLRF